MPPSKPAPYASPGWDVDVDPEWAEGLFSTFLQHARKRMQARASAGEIRPARIPMESPLLEAVTLVEPVEIAPRQDDTIEDPIRLGPILTGSSEAPEEVVEEATVRRSLAEVEAAQKDLGPEDVEELLGEMATLCKYGHVEQAISEARRRFELHPADLGLRRVVIDFLVDRKLVAYASEELSRLAAILYRRGDEEGLREVATTLLRVDPKSAKARRLLDLLEPQKT